MKALEATKFFLTDVQTGLGHFRQPIFQALAGVQAGWASAPIPPRAQEAIS
jgi:hypothetical protein